MTGVTARLKGVESGRKVKREGEKAGGCCKERGERGGDIHRMETKAASAKRGEKISMNEVENNSGMEKRRKSH